MAGMEQKTETYIMIWISGKVDKTEEYENEKG